ncbi:MAG: serine protease [Burkholderiales bacterium]|nr:MAG: serine protease [Burkholderiales bacterium]
MKTWAVDTAFKRLLFHTLRVDTVLQDGSSGTGTAFVLAHTHARGRSLFVVTNRHLVEGVVSGALVFTIAREGQPVLGSRFELRIEDFPDAWMAHPDAAVDLAIMPLQPLLDAAQAQGVSLYWQAIDSQDALAEGDARWLDALEDVLFVGYPSGVWDQVNGMPILRRGITATPPGLDFEGRQEFLIDAAVYPGSSGSPVFIPKPSPQGGRAFWFAGVVAAVFYREEAQRLVPVPVPASQTQAGVGSEMIDLGLVVKASEVRELVQAYLSRWIS